MTTIKDALVRGTALLGHADARREAEILLAHALDADRTVLYARPERVLSPAEDERYAELVARRASGWPVAYLTAHREFHGLSLIVTPDVLIPRHETETLVELALEHIPDDRAVRVADLGTGSGAIALAIASARGTAHVDAVDLSECALAVAAMNAHALELENVAFHHGTWFEPLGGRRYDVVVSNPPYVREADAHLDEGDLRYEPRAALVSGEDGLDAIREIAAAAPAHLETGAVLLVEHGFDQGPAVRAIFERAGLREVRTARDLEARERVTIGVR
jgi:release factor glutamine methyltransferase